jgi:hypothetical protein
MSVLPSFGLVPCVIGGGDMTVDIDVLRGMMPAKMEVWVNDMGRTIISFGPLPVALNVGDSFEMELSPNDAGRFGAVMSAASICAQIENDVDEIESPV